jgi:hypothetical protein
MSWVAVGVGVVGAATSAYGASQQKKAAKAAAGAGGAGVDINDLDAQARALSKRNLADSVALEKQYNPEVAALRQQATAALIPYAEGNDTARNALRSELFSDFSAAGSGQPLARSALLDDAIAKARSDLALGGGLSTSARNEVTRRAGVTAAGVGGGRLGLGRDISARDLGISALQLENQRLNNAASLGGQDQGVIQAQAQYADQLANRRLSQASLLSDLDSQTFNQRLALAQFGQGIARPESGLDPSSLVNLTVGNQNASNAAAQNAAAVRAQSANSLMGAGGQLLGVAGGLYANRQPKTTTTVYPQNNNLPAYNGAFNQPAPTYTAPTLRY